MSEHGSFKEGHDNEHGEQKGGLMIWDAIDMIMPLRGLLALSCLDLV